MKPARLAAILLAAATLGLAACGDDDDGDTTVTETETVSTTPTDETTTETGGEGVATTGVEDPPSGPGTEGPAFFSTPTGNIGCSIDTKFARCDIAEKDWTAPAPESKCELDYGNGIQFDPTSGPTFTCAGDTTLAADEQLGYGERAQRGTIYCDSSEAGVTCLDINTAAGFFISRGSYELFPPG